MTESQVSELFGHSIPGDVTQADQSDLSVASESIDWHQVTADQQCPYIGGRCFKIRKSDPATSIGTCTVRHGKALNPLVICPARFVERHQIFLDCLHLLTTHVPGNELHIVSEVAVPGGSVDYFLVSALDGKVKDFVGIEVQSLDTTGTVWPDRQRVLRAIGVKVSDDADQSQGQFGINWKMTAKTILVQIHHKIKTFEYLNRKLVLVLQDRLLEYMQREFSFSHVQSPLVGNSMHFHAYEIVRDLHGSLRLKLSTRYSTDAEGVELCLGLQSSPKVELNEIHNVLEKKISQNSSVLLTVTP